MKYEVIASNAKSALQINWTVKVFTFIVGSIGSWWPENDQLVKQLEISSKFKIELSCKVAYSCAYSSTKIWDEFRYKAEVARNNDNT